MNETPDRRDKALEEKPKKPAADPKRNSTRRLFLALAGGYLIYLAIQLGLGIYRGEVAEKERVYIIIAMVVFALFGVFALVWNLIAALRGFRESIAAMDDYENDEPDKDEDDEEEEEDDEEPLAIEPPEDEE